MRIVIRALPAAEMRYATAGDWELQDSTDFGCSITVDDTGNDDFNLLIAIHELIEAYLCRKHAISQETVDDWDLSHLGHEDPGSINGCPYAAHHALASVIEGFVGSALGVNPQDYAEAIYGREESKEVPQEGA